MKIRYITKYNKKTQDIRCKCGGQVMVDGEATYQRPLGIGSHGNGDGKIYVDSIIYKGWFGSCLDCQETVLAYYSKKLKSKVLKAIVIK
jgi:hypothetical protein